ncbi:MAG: alpha-mannosidase, partial [Firmicutes bacterium]|nr:alpha-mannosidase [Bacillota bacterium]
MKHKKLYMIGNAHIDPVWLWRWQEGFQEVKATFRSALDRMNENPDFKFTSSSSIFYEWVENSNPAMFDEIKKRVAEGRWEITGGWVIEPDCNIPSGESFVRQGLYGQRYFKEKFNKTAITGYNIDSFGHNGSLPQILKKSGLDNYVFMRPMPNEKGIPNRVFWWVSNDGSRVLTYRIPYEYCTGGKDLETNLNRLKTEIKEDENELMFFYGVGNHGGGPTKANIKSIEELNAVVDNPKLVFSTTEEFFDSIRKDNKEYPVVQDDLQHHASGCYSVHSGIKKWNRRSENMLITAEKFSTIASIVKNQPYPKDFERAWKRVLFNQFHDILAGTSLISAYEDTRNMHGEALSIAETNLNYAIQSISWDIDIEEDEDMRPIVVFNPHSWAGKMVCELEARGLSNDNYKLIDDQGSIVLSQRIQSETVTGQSRLLFVAELPSMGYRVYRLYLNQDDIQQSVNVRVENNTLENNRLKIEINPDTGNVKSFYDKQCDLEIFRREGARLVVIEDKSDTWSHNVFKFDKEICNMKPIYIRIMEEGPVRSVLRVRYKYNDSYVNQDFRMYRDLDYVEVKVDVDWREPLTMLKVKFPVSFDSGKPTYEIPYGYIEKTVNGEEEAGQNWIDFSGKHIKKSVMYGLAIANDAKYSYAFDVDEMGITILKNSVFAHHDPAKLNPKLEYTYVDHGIQSFTYAMLPHEGSWENSDIIRVAQELNQRPSIIIETYHKGGLPQVNSFVSVNNKQVIVSVVKEAEDKDGIVIRAYETLKQPVDVEISLPFLERMISLHFEPCE